MSKTLPDLPPSLKCYWVVPGRFLAGEYPASRFFENQTNRILDGLLALGIDTFIDLTQPGELPSYEATLHETAGWLNKSFLYRHFPIPDFEIPSIAEMQTILAFVNHRLNDSHNLYCHCYAGIGRTGTLVGCFLADRCGSGEAALKELAGLRRQLPNAFMRSPESDSQWDMVKNWGRGA